MHSCAEVKQNVEKVCECTGEEKKAPTQHCLLCQKSKQFQHSALQLNVR